MNRFLLAVIFLIPAVGFAADDPIKTELDDAQAKHAESLTAASTKLVAAMDAKLKDVAGKGDLDGATLVKTQKEQFEKDGTLPKAPQLIRARTSYESEVRAAREMLRKALEKAKDAYTKALKLDEAQALAAELKTLGAEIKGTVAEPADDLNSKFAEGSVWKGTCKEKRGNMDLTFDLAITIATRKGQTFDGRYEVGDGKFVYLIEGALHKDQVTFKFTKVDKHPKEFPIKNLIGVENKGTLKIDPKSKKPTLTSSYTWRNMNNTGVNAEGTMTLVLEK
jgi:hypothetical protein